MIPFLLYFSSFPLFAAYPPNSLLYENIQSGHEPFNVGVYIWTEDAAVKQVS